MNKTETSVMTYYFGARYSSCPQLCRSHSQSWGTHHTV